MISILGMIFLLGVAVLLSENRRAIRLRTVIGALTIQIILGSIALYFTWGQNVLIFLSGRVQKVIDYAQDGIVFLFGGLVSQQMYETFGSGGFVFAFRVLPIVIFFSSLLSVLYYVGVMGFIIRFIGGGLQKLLKTSRPESMSATANIFVGQTEAPLVVKPFLDYMTRSELFAVMTGGMASVAGAVLAGYVGLGADLKFLIAASFMAAPGGLLMAKIIIPETEEPHQNLEEVGESYDGEPVNVLDAAAQGASAGLSLALNIGAMLIAFIGIIALLNGMIQGLGDLVGYPDITLQMILGWIFYPVAYLLGVPSNDISQVASLIGQKLVLNEFVAFVEFAKVMEGMEPLSQAITTFALCGFANLSSIAILLGGLGTIAPKQRPLISKLGLKAVVAGTLSNLMSASIAGLFISFL
ncbi:MAG: NupC/NupG family nucleoside CNT transporter [Leptospira sp.]|nr:NupC/NupG family nucleoside CNT transporter [Leptospira sp.]